VSPAGRRAALPGRGYQAPERLLVAGDECRVVFVAERDGARSEFVFSGFPVNPVMRRWFAAMFTKASGPSGVVRTTSSARTAYAKLKMFARYLGALERPPGQPGDLKPVHWDGYVLSRQGVKGVSGEIGTLRSLLRCAQEVPEPFLTRVSITKVRRDTSALSSYTEPEFRRITAAARAHLRETATRIWSSRDLLARWRAGQIDRKTDFSSWTQGRLLDHLDRHGDVPRYDKDQSIAQPVRDNGGAQRLVSRLHLVKADIGAAVALLICLTGQNVSTLATAPARHHRPDGHAGPGKTALVDLSKARRGRSKADMTVAFRDTPAGDGPAAGEVTTVAERRLDLRSPFGVYALLLDLAGPARDHLRSDRLFVHYGFLGACGRGFRTGLPKSVVADWSESAGLVSDTTGDDGTVLPLRADCSRLRLTWLQLHERPVAHAEQTLANEYLARDRGNLAEYQRVVARTLDEQVTAARSSVLMRTISANELALARADPRAVADRHGLAVDVLEQVLSGDLDTVLGACTDHTNSPHAPAGTPCRASFLLCLSCPCARATPAHLPLLAGVHDRLLARRPELQPLRWAERFAGPVAQLAELLARFPERAVAAARTEITAGQHALIERFLTRGLDL
jgi:hypothetical protein